MAGFGITLTRGVFVVAFLSGVIALHAQEEQPLPPPPLEQEAGPMDPPHGREKPPKPLHGKPGREKRGGSEAMPDWVDQPDKLKASLDKMPEDQRKRFLKNLKEWQKLPPEQRTWLRNQEKMRREQRKKEFEQLLEENGIKLDEKQREEFGRRFFEERRKIEELLRREMNERRKPLVQEAIERLKKEFAEQSSAVPEAKKVP